jgi:hypothetical protein
MVVAHTTNSTILSLNSLGRGTWLVLLSLTKRSTAAAKNLEITEEYEDAKRRFQLGKKVRIVITDESLGFL